MKDLKARFSEVEKRVKTVIAENRDLRKRIAELERDLALAREESQELQAFHGKRLHIREKIERILGSLENIEKK